MAHPLVMTGLGEVLWDILPSGRVLGGAPANFAYMAAILGDEGVVASRIGIDDLGRDACTEMRNHGLNTQYVQHDALHKTGTTQVKIDSTGQPTFTIEETVSWDFLEWTPVWEELSARADVVCFGSLAQRSAISAATIGRFLRNMPGNALRIFDVNLRGDFYSSEVLRRSLDYAHIVKANDHELLKLGRLLGFDSEDETTTAKQLLREFQLRLICVTRGRYGSLLVSRSEFKEHKGFTVDVADTVGAGDAFTACMAHNFIRGQSLQEISERSNRFAAWVTTQVGATPQLDRAILQEVCVGQTSANGLDVSSRRRSGTALKGR
jgi:fructokinase